MLRLTTLNDGYVGGEAPYPLYNAGNLVKLGSWFLDSSGKLEFFNVSGKSSAISTNWPSWIHLTTLVGIGGIPPPMYLGAVGLSDAQQGVG